MDQKLTSYYDVLEISPQASDEEVRNAYRRMALRLHPDQNTRNKSYFENRFRMLNEAYAHLKTGESRARYNHILKSAAEPLAMNNNTKSPSLLAQVAGLFRRPVKG